MLSRPPPALYTIRFKLSVGGGDNDPPMEKGRNGIYNFICDTSVPESNGPEPVSNVTKKNKTKTKKNTSPAWCYSLHEPLGVDIM